MESICDDPEIIAENIKVRGGAAGRSQASNYLEFMAQLCISFQQVKSGSPDYADRDVEEAMEDFIQRIECYKSSYMPIDDERDRSHQHLETYRPH